MNKRTKNFLQGCVFIVLGLALFMVPKVIDRWAEVKGAEGKILIASDTLRDGVFDETVIYVVWHDLIGASGLIVNKVDRRTTKAELMGQSQNTTAVKSTHNLGMLPAGDYATSKNTPPHNRTAPTAPMSGVETMGGNLSRCDL